MFKLSNFIWKLCFTAFCPLLWIGPETKHCKKTVRQFCVTAAETDTSSLLWGSPRCLRAKYNDVLSSQRNNLPACLLQRCWLRFYLTNFGFSICLHLNRTMTPFQKLFYFRKSQAVYSQSSQKYANKTQDLGFQPVKFLLYCACGTVWFLSAFMPLYYHLRCIDLRTCAAGMRWKCC